MPAPGFGAYRMKKTITATISGSVFHIEEDAYDKLLRYLDSIRAQFAGSPGGAEIMGDIEARVAELLQSRLYDSRTGVTMADVEHVIGVMGQPEDYRDPLEEGSTTPSGSGGPYVPPGNARRRLFRDPDDRWVGGVLSGFAAYFGMDPLVLRLIYIVLLFLGVGWLIYLILWVVVPVAGTAAEKLEMRGEPVNVDNIKRMFEESAERVRTGAGQVGREAQEMGRQYAPRAQRTAREAGSALRDLLRLFFTALAKVIGVVLLAVGAVLAVVLMVALVGEFTLIGIPGTRHGMGELNDLALLIFGDRSFMQLAWLAFIVVVLVPVIGLIHGGISLLFNVRSPRWFGWSLSALWIIAIITMTALGTYLLGDVRHREVVEERATLEQPEGNTIILASSGSEQEFHQRRRRTLSHVRVEGDRVDLGWATADVRRSPDSLFHLVVQRRARGGSYKAAMGRAGAIEAGWEQNGSRLELAPWFSFHSEDLYRGQNVRYILEVPVGGSVHFERSAGGMLHDIDNVNGTLDQHMIGNTWTMTEAGLDDGRGASPPRNRGKGAPKSWTITWNPSLLATSRAATALAPRLDLPGLFLRRYAL
jgi:phage shock protein PspC (stress-responsive transcriptional regulator)